MSSFDRGHPLVVITPRNAKGLTDNTDTMLSEIRDSIRRMNEELEGLQLTNDELKTISEIHHDTSDVLEQISERNQRAFDELKKISEGNQRTIDDLEKEMIDTDTTPVLLKIRDISLRTIGELRENLQQQQRIADGIGKQSEIIDRISDEITAEVQRCREIHERVFDEIHKRQNKLDG